MSCAFGEKISYNDLAVPITGFKGTVYSNHKITHFPFSGSDIKLYRHYHVEMQIFISAVESFATNPLRVSCLMIFC